MNLLNIFITLVLFMPSLLMAAEKDCFSKASAGTSKIIEEAYKKNLKANEVSSMTKSVIGAGRWTNGAHFLSNKSDDRKNKFGEDGPYLTYNIKSLVNINGGRGRDKGYRLDPSFEVRVNPETCEVIKVIYVGGFGDTQTAYPVIGHTIEASGATKKIYSEAEAATADQYGCQECSCGNATTPTKNSPANK